MSGPREGIRSLSTTLLALILLGIGAGALAFWAATGSGSGSVSTGATIPLILTPGTSTTTLYPGGSSDVVLTVSNPNTSPIKVTSLALANSEGSNGFAVNGVSAGGCALSFASQTNLTIGWLVPAKTNVNGTLAITLPGAITMGVSAANDCQHRGVTVYLTADK